MPQCPHCSHEEESIAAFSYKIAGDQEGHDIDSPLQAVDQLSEFLVCPDCDAILAGV